MQCVVDVRLEHYHSSIDRLDNHSTASGPAWCRRCRPPGNAVSGHSSTMCLVVWWLSPQGLAGDAITPHLWRDSAHLAWPHLRRFSVTNWRLGSVNPGCGHVGSFTRSCPMVPLESNSINKKDGMAHMLFLFEDLFGKCLLNIVQCNNYSILTAVSRVE